MIGMAERPKRALKKKKFSSQALFFMQSERERKIINQTINDFGNDKVLVKRNKKNMENNVKYKG